MKKNVAINGFGRIGRIVCKALINDKDVNVVAINDLSDPEEMAYLYKYDSVHGICKDEIKAGKDSLTIGNKKVKILCEREAENLPWKKLNVDLVIECTGAYTKLEDAQRHIKAGAKHVVISAPGKGDMKTIVYGVNEKTLNGDEEVFSAASCTTNALAPMLKCINDAYGIKKGFMSTIHAYTNDQANLDVHHKKGHMSRRGRACALNIIPTSTGAASAIGKVIPELEGKMKGNAFRVPVGDGSMIDLSLILDKKVTVEDINKLFESHQSKSLKFTMDPIVSSDVIDNPAGGVVDGLLTDMIDDNEQNFVKIVGWYDNEYGYSMQLARTVKHFLKKQFIKNL